MPRGDTDDDCCLRGKEVSMWILIFLQGWRVEGREATFPLAPSLVHFLKLTSGEQHEATHLVLTGSQHKIFACKGLFWLQGGEWIGAGQEWVGRPPASSKQALCPPHALHVATWVSPALTSAIIFPLNYPSGFTVSEIPLPTSAPPGLWLCTDVALFWGKRGATLHKSFPVIKTWAKLTDWIFYTYCLHVCNLKHNCYLN